MEKGIDLIDRKLSFEEFEHLAANIPKRPGRTVHSLIEIDIIDDSDETLSVYPEFRISHCCKVHDKNLKTLNFGL